MDFSTLDLTAFSVTPTVTEPQHGRFNEVPSRGVWVNSDDYIYTPDINLLKPSIGEIHSRVENSVLYEQVIQVENFGTEAIRQHTSISSDSLLSGITVEVIDSRKQVGPLSFKENACLLKENANEKIFEGRLQHCGDNLSDSLLNGITLEVIEPGNQVGPVSFKKSASSFREAPKQRYLLPNGITKEEIDSCKQISVMEDEKNPKEREGNLSLKEFQETVLPSCNVPQQESSFLNGITSEVKKSSEERSPKKNKAKSKGKLRSPSKSRRPASSPKTPQKTAKHRERREKANEREKQRIVVLQNAMNVLKNAIPAAREKTKITKLEVLKLARDYINALRAQLLEDNYNVNELETAKSQQE